MGLKRLHVEQGEAAFCWVLALSLIHTHRAVFVLVQAVIAVHIDCTREPLSFTSVPLCR